MDVAWKEQLALSVNIKTSLEKFNFRQLGFKTANAAKRGLQRLKSDFLIFKQVDEELSLQDAHLEHPYFLTNIFMKTEKQYLENERLFIFYFIDLEVSEKSQSSCLPQIFDPIAALQPEVLLCDELPHTLGIKHTNSSLKFDHSLSNISSQLCLLQIPKFQEEFAFDHHSAELSTL